MVGKELMCNRSGCALLSTNDEQCGQAPTFVAEEVVRGALAEQRTAACLGKFRPLLAAARVANAVISRCPPKTSCPRLPRARVLLCPVATLGPAVLSARVKGWQRREAKALGMQRTTAFLIHVSPLLAATRVADAAIIDCPSSSSILRHPRARIVASPFAILDGAVLRAVVERSRRALRHEDGKHGRNKPVNNTFATCEFIVLQDIKYRVGVL